MQLPTQRPAGRRAPLTPLQVVPKDQVLPKGTKVLPKGTKGGTGCRLKVPSVQQALCGIQMCQPIFLFQILRVDCRDQTVLLALYDQCLLGGFGHYKYLSTVLLGPTETPLPSDVLAWALHNSNLCFTCKLIFNSTRGFTQIYFL